ncbi:MAG: LCP family protein [Acidimicrobiales bacterium]|nr:LCP family protein [Acidimicrobiales bacterium]
MTAPSSGTRRLRRTWPQRLLLGFNVFLILTCLVTAGGLGYFFYKFGQLPRIALGHVLTPESEEDPGEPQNFLVVGSDSRVIDPNDPTYDAFGSAEDIGGQRSDTIMVVRVDPRSQRAAILSIPRDLWVPIAGTGGKQRINTAYSEGPDRLIQTIQDAFDIPIHHYVEVNFAGFRGLVNAVDGVPVYFAAPARDDNTGLSVSEAGCVVLSGDQALAYARSRHYKYYEGGSWRTDGTGDLGRISRQQDFIRRALKQAVTKGVRNPVVLQRLVDVGIQNVAVDNSLSARDLLKLGQRFRSLDPNTIEMFSVPTTPAMINGAAVLLVQEAEAQPILDVFRGIEPPPPGAIGPSEVQVRILNGVGESGLASRASDAITGAGFTVSGTGDADSYAYERTTIRYAPGQEAAADLLARHLTNGAVLEATSTVNSADVVLILGQDFTTVTQEAAAVPPSTGAPADAPPPTVTTTTIGVTPPAEVPCG